MNRIRTLSQRFTIPFALAIAPVLFVITRGISAVYMLIPETYFSRLMYEFINILWPAGLAVLCGYGFIFSKKGFGQTLKAGIGVLIFYSMILAVAVLNFALTPEVQWKSLPEIIYGIIMLAGVGLREEILFRGIIGNALCLKYAKTAKGMWFAILLSGCLFGFVHMFNITAGVTFSGALIQSMGAAGLGVLFGAIYLRGGNIWVPVLLHGVVDASGLFESTFVVSGVTGVDQMNDLNIISATVVPALILLITAYLLRKTKQPAIFERLEKLRTGLEIQI